MGQESKWGKGQDGPLWLKAAVKTIESNWAKKSHLRPGPSWVWPTNILFCRMFPGI